jgi:hypothetical protein
MVMVEASLDELALTKPAQYWPSLPLSQMHVLLVHTPASEHSPPSLMHPATLLTATPSQVNAFSRLRKRRWRPASIDA